MDGPFKPMVMSIARELRSLAGSATENSKLIDVHAPTRDPRGQIKTRERVRDLAEVYTHEREVNAMLDLVPDMFPAASTNCRAQVHLLQ